MKQRTAIAMLFSALVLPSAGSVSAQEQAPQREPLFRQGVCGGLICDFNLEGGKTVQQVEAEKVANPQNCGGIMCDMGMRAFPTQEQLAARQAAQAQAAAEPPPAEPVKPKKAKHKRIAKAQPAEPAATTAAAEPKPN